MTIFLTSSPTGPLDGSRPVFGIDEKNRFVENLQARWKDNARCLTISAAPADAAFNDYVEGSMRGSFQRSGFPIGAFDTWDDRTVDFSAAILHSYDVILLGGGHVPTQNAFLQRIGLREKLQGFGGIIIGISAGTMNSADTVYAQPEEPGESIDPNYRRFLPGLGLTKTNILPHYQMLRDNLLDGRRLFEDITYPDSFGHHFLALTDGSYLLIEGGREMLFGEGYCIADGHIRQICADGETLDWTTP